MFRYKNLWLNKELSSKADFEIGKWSDHGFHFIILSLFENSVQQIYHADKCKKKSLK